MRLGKTTRNRNQALENKKQELGRYQGQTKEKKE